MCNHSDEQIFIFPVACTTVQKTGSTAGLSDTGCNPYFVGLATDFFLKQRLATDFKV